MADTIHIVCFNAPAPADYGGAIDVYAKIKALAGAGADIILHYFQYQDGRGHAGLEPFCKAIFTYKRKSFRQCLAYSLPYIVASRVNRELIERLNGDKYPVLLEGIHCTGILPYLAKDRKVVLRLHNNEAAYYRQLAQRETRPLRNLFYSSEATRLERYQQKLAHEVKTAAISLAEQAYFTNRLGWAHVTWIPAFTPWLQAHFRSYAEPYCLYHGDLSVNDNALTAQWLAEHIFDDGAAHLIVAGKNPPQKLVALLTKAPNCTIIPNPSDEYLEQLIGKAQVNLVPALGGSGVKLKLVHALLRGRHVVANAVAIEGSGLEGAVQLAEDLPALKQCIARLMQAPFGQKEMAARAQLLAPYDPQRNAHSLLALLFDTNAPPG